MHQLQAVFTLLFIYQIKHFIVDYPLQNEYMLGKFKAEGWMKPLAAHAGLHGLFTWVVVAPIVGPFRGFGLALFDFCIHFAMDRIKASPNMLGGFKQVDSTGYTVARSLLGDPEATFLEKHRAHKLLRHNTYFWWALGLDQMVHHLTHYAIIAIVVVS